MRGRARRVLRAVPLLVAAGVLAACSGGGGGQFAEESGDETTMTSAPGAPVPAGQLETARAFAATVLLFALAIALYGLFALLERRVVDWTPRTAPRGGP